MSKISGALIAALLLLLALTGSVLAQDNNNETVITISDCPDPVVTITFRVLDESEQGNGAVTYRILSGDATVVADTTVETDADFAATVTHTLPAGEYVIRWDDETQIDNSFDDVDFAVPVCQAPPTSTPTGDVAPTQGTNPPAPTGDVAPTQGTNVDPTLPPTDTLDAATPPGPTSSLSLVLLMLGIGSAASLIATFARRRRSVATVKEPIER